MAGVREIAKLAGVSQATVSRVLNRDENFSVSNKTRDKIFEIANELQYNPKDPVRSRGGDKLSVVVITSLSRKSEINDPYFISIRDGVEKEANAWGVRIMSLIRFPQDGFEYKQLSAYGGVIVIGALTERALKKIYAYNKNLVVLDDHRSFPNYDVVENDFPFQIRQELEILYANGHRNIAYIGGDATLVDENGKTKEVLKDVRETEYEEWMELKKIKSVVVYAQWSTEEGIKAAETLVNEHPNVTAVIVASDPLAVGVYRGLQKAGKRIPQDVAIFSFDDIQVAKFLVPSLSTVKPGSEEMGKMAIRLIRDRLFDHRSVAIRVSIPSIMERRESI